MTPFAARAEGPRHFIDQAPETRFVGRALSGWQADLIAIAEAMFLRDDGPPDRARLEWFAHHMADFLDNAGARTRLVLRGSLASLVLGIPLFAGRPGRLDALSVQERLRGLEKAEKSPLGLACFAIKAMSCIIWYEHPDSAREIGFAGGCKGRSAEGESA